MDVSKEKAAAQEKTVIEKRPQQALLDAIGGEPLAGSGFEEETPEPAFAEQVSAETSASDLEGRQNPA